ncbi:MAG: Gldg family protein, partial [Anaerolineae bacterium]
PYSMITKDMTGLTSFFPYARSIERTGSTPEGATITDLITTSDQSWGETNLTQRQVQRDDADVAGPLTLMVQVQKGNTRLVLVGDSDFVANSVLNSVRGAFGNADLFINAVNWLAEEESLIAISPKTSDVRTVFLTPAQMRVILYSSALVLPVAVLIIGLVVWWRRR